MGCCLSTSGKHHPSGRLPQPPTPPAEEEEETVKEVLLETPILPRSAGGNERSDNKSLGNQHLIAEVDPTAAIQHLNLQKPTEETEIIVSEVSEKCSFSESFSSTTAPEKDDGQRPPARKRQGYGRVRGKDPARRNAAPSVENRGQLVPLGIFREQRQCADAEMGRSRYAGESSGRRSRSPARRGGVGVHRNAGDTAENSVGNVDLEDDVVSADPEAESFENPVVSLECFIFL